jgi:CheY-like chemotaxis protein
MVLPKVLVVEDDDIIREIYAMKFQLEGFPVASAENGQIGLKMVEEFRPDIILLDMMMPVMGGLDFMRSLNDATDDVTDEMPTIIVFSNISAPQQVDAVMQLGAKAYWIKSDYTPDRVTGELMKLWGLESSGAGGVRK